MHLYTEDSWILIKWTITEVRSQKKTLLIFIQTVVKNSAKELKALYYFLMSSIEVSQVHSDTCFQSTKERSSSRLYVWFSFLFFISSFSKMGEYPYSRTYADVVIASLPDLNYFWKNGRTERKQPTTYIIY